MRSTLRTLGCLAFALAPALSFAAPLRNRITQPVVPGDTVEIARSVHPRVIRSLDMGPVAPETQLQSMTLQFSQSAEQQTALDQLLSDLQNPASPRYHQWLTPAQYAAQFGLSAADIAKVTAWLNSQGFTVTGVANGGQFIRFTGTAAQAQVAFGTAIHNVSYNGETHYANVTSTAIPNAISTVVSGVTGLQNFGFKPRVRAGSVRPEFTSSISGNHFLAPGDAYTIYGMQGLMNSGFDGTGLTIAVTGQVDINPADVTAFRNAAGLSAANPPTTVHETADPGAARNCSSSTSNNCPSPNQDDLAEASIDVEWSSAMAPGATILFVNGPQVMSDAMTQAIDQNLAPIVTTSYGACESAWGATELNQLNALFQQAAAQGQTVIGPSGDVGAPDCDVSQPATKGLAVDFPGSSPYVTAMGGTQFNDGTATGATQYWSNTEGTTAHGGSALGYIPESVWNDAGGFGAGGGGASSFFSKPSWQQGTGVPNDGQRDVPDLSLAASDSHDEFLYCINVATGSSCQSGGWRASDTTLKAAGGTSLDSQIFGGMIALIEQKAGGRLGSVNAKLYALANNPLYYTAGANILTNSSVIFNDVTSGDNKMPCTAGSTNCPSGTTAIGYSATPGYDLATGWGTINLTNLATAWTAGSSGGGSGGGNGGGGGGGGSGGGGGTQAVSTTTLTDSSTTVAAGASVTLTATVSGSSGTPTGTVQFLVNGTVVAFGTLVNGVATTTYVTSCANLTALNTPVAMPAAPSGRTHRVWYQAGSGVFAACLLFIALPRRRRLGNLYAVLLALALTSCVVGCGGGSAAANSSSSSGSTATTGHLTITASYSGDSAYAASVASGQAGLTVTVTRGGC